MIAKFLMIVLGISFILGQVARIQSGNIGFTLLDISVALVAILWFGYRLLKRKKIFELLLPVKFYLSFVGIGILSLILFSPNLTFYQLGTAFLYTARLLAYSSLYFVAKNVNQKDRDFALGMIPIVGGTIVVLGYIQYLFYPYLRNLYYLGWDDHLYRLFSVFLDPNFAGSYFTLFFFLVLDMVVITKKPLKKLVLMGISLVTLGALFLTYSRTGFIMLFVGSAIYFFTFSSKKIALGVLGFLVMIFLLLANTKIEGLNPFRTASISARIESAGNALAIIQQYPLLGVGFNAYRYAQMKLELRQENPPIPSHADAGTDNSYLFVLATTGIIGFSFFAAFWYVCVKQVKQLVKAHVEFSRSLLAALGSVFVGSLFLHILFYPMIVGWLVIHAGLIRRK